MVAGATAFSFAYLPAFYLFSVPALAPLVVRLMTTGQPIDAHMGAMVAVFAAAMTYLARRSHLSFHRQAELAVRNDRLVEHLSDAREQLERRVADRTSALELSVRQLRAAELQARQAVDARDQFMAVASHELRTPLTVLDLCLSRLDRQVLRPGAVDTCTLADNVRVLRRQGKRLTGLVDTLLETSGLSRRAVELQPRELDLAVLVQVVVADLTGAASDGAGMELRLPPEPVPGRWDPVRLEQVVVNLVSNAVKYGAGKPVTVTLEADRNDARLTVRDQGPGIAPAVKQRIFDRFFRADAASSTGGLGLGLAVVREIVEAMGGSVDVASEPGRGAAFTVRLPRWP
jgi:signal transduction histidine kinase